VIFEFKFIIFSVNNFSELETVWSRLKAALNVRLVSIYCNHLVAGFSSNPLNYVYFKWIFLLFTHKHVNIVHMYEVHDWCFWIWLRGSVWYCAVSRKKDTRFLITTSADVDRFSKIFHCWIPRKFST